MKEITEEILSEAYGKGQNRFTDIDLYSQPII